MGVDNVVQFLQDNLAVLQGSLQVLFDQVVEIIIIYLKFEVCDNNL